MDKTGIDWYYISGILGRTLIIKVFYIISRKAWAVKDGNAGGLRQERKGMEGKA